MACGIEHDEEHHHTKHIEEHVGQGGTASLRVGGERSHEGSNRRTNVLTHRQGGSLFEAETRDVHAEEHQRDGHRGCRRLHDHRHHSTHDDEEQNGEERVLRHMRQHACHHVADIHGGGSLL